MAVNNIEGMQENLNENSPSQEGSEKDSSEVESKLEKEVNEIEENNKALRNLINSLDEKKAVTTISKN